MNQDKTRVAIKSSGGVSLHDDESGKCVCWQSKIGAQKWQNMQLYAYPFNLHFSLSSILTKFIFSMKLAAIKFDCFWSTNI